MQGGLPTGLFLRVDNFDIWIGNSDMIPVNTVTS